MKRMNDDRRYPMGLHPDYDAHFNAGYQTSPRNQNKDLLSSLHSGELPGRQNLVAKAEGCEKEIIYCTEQLADLAERFDLVNESRINLGLSILKAYPSDLMKEKFKIEARLDNAKLDLQFLKDRIRQGDKEKAEAEDDQVLAYGIRLSKVQAGGKLQSIDGLPVKYVGGIPVINLKTHKYHGVSVADYSTRIYPIYQQARLEAQRLKLERLQNEAMQAGRPIPQQLPVRSPKKIDKSSLPEVPEDVKKYL